MEEKFELLEKKLKTHDWYYEYSDDHSVWRRGVEAEAALNRLVDECKVLDKDRTEALYKLLNPRLVVK